MKTLEEYHGERQKLFLPKSDWAIPDQEVRSARAGKPAIKIEDAEIADLTARVLKRRVLRVEKPAAGCSTHQMWMVDLLEESVIVRANSLPDDLTDFPMVIEAGITRHLAELGFPVPETRCVDLTRTRLRTDFSIATEAPGIPLTNLEDEERMLSPLLTQLGQWMARWHKDTVDSGYGWITIDPGNPIGHGEAKKGFHGLQEYWCDYLELNFDSHLQRCVELKAIDSVEAARIESWFARLGPTFQQAPSALLHNDPCPANVYTDGRKIRAIIDWEDAIIGDPIFDVAAWAIFNPVHRHATFMKGYFAEQSKPADFHTRFWFYYTRLALAWTVLRDRIGVVDSPEKTPSSKQIRFGLQELNRLDIPTRRAG